MAGVWRVVHKPRVAVRMEPRASAEVAGSVRFGQVLRPVEAEGPWVRLLGDEAEGVPRGWVLSDGSSVGLGPLLERIDSRALRLAARSPLDGSVLCELELRADAPPPIVMVVCQRVAEASGLRPDAMLATRSAQAGRTERPEPSEVLPPGARLCDLGLEGGGDFHFFYEGELPRQRLGGAAEAARRRLEAGGGTWDDVRAAVAGGWQGDAAEALLAGLSRGSRRSCALLVGWSFAPELHGMVREGAGAPTALLFGWGGASLRQLEPPRLWWRQRGFSTLATTGCPRRLSEQVREVIGFLGHDGPVVVHAFSNTGLYMLQAFCQEWKGRIDGVVVDSAPGFLSTGFLRQVFNGCIRSLCQLHSVSISTEADKALVGIQPTYPLEEGDVLEFTDPDGSSGVGHAVIQPDGEVLGWLVHDQGEHSRVDRGAVEAALGGPVDGPLSMQQALKLKAFQVVPTSYPDFTDLFLNYGMPALFLYSTHDYLIKAKAIKDYIGTFTKAGQATSVCFERSGHVEHFAKHRERYTEELGRFVDGLRLS
ncbi:unnamed protein product [Prorocentrum cordatum]|uniref:Uncharacterized protein n=1 Tax=Prorocentrum cordatum TaxID=2364126 RepID=A0ABN9PI23_9DINO|nr:unnamed protein product [Polarella glacialis]